MDYNTHESSFMLELDDDDRAAISNIFHREIVPKLSRLNARKGNISCDFAGEKYKKWTILFDTMGSDFEIIDFEYDEESAGIDLDL